MLVTNLMRSQIVDAILSIWAPGEECLTYSQIKQRSVSKGLINKTNDRSLSRWLGNLVEDGMLRKTQNGYFLETKPKVYQVFDYLSQLRQKYPKYIYEGEVGGWISHVCALTYLNFDETLMQKFDERLAFEIISTRIGHLFGALYTLKNDVLKRRCGLSQLRLNDEVVREALFGLLNKSIGENHETEELVGKYLRYLGKIEQKMFDQIWAQNKSKGDFDYADYLGQDFFVENIEEDPQGYKKFLKKESLNIEKYSIDELINKYIKIQQSIELKHKPENPKEEYGYALTEEEAELENNYRTAILTKVAEGIKALETNTEDFAIILTRHPATMNQYFTPEHILYEAMKWAASPPEEDLLKEMWQEIHEEEKTFEAMVAERLAQYNSLTKEKVEALRSKPWVKNELSKLGNFDEILRLYAEKRNKYLREREKQVKSFFERFDKGLENLEDTKTK
jgi:hypothetical protein